MPAQDPSGVSCGVNVGRWAPCRGSHTFRIQNLGGKRCCDNEERERTISTVLFFLQVKSQTIFFTHKNQNLLSLMSGN